MAPGAARYGLQAPERLWHRLGPHSPLKALSPLAAVVLLAAEGFVEIRVLNGRHLWRPTRKYSTRQCFLRLQPPPP